MFTCCELFVSGRMFSLPTGMGRSDGSIDIKLNSKSSWKSSHRLSQFRRYNISNDSCWSKVLSKTSFFSTGSRPDICSRNKGRTIINYFSSALLFVQSVQSPGYFMPQWSHVPFQSCNSVPGFALFSKSLLMSHLNVLFFLWLTFVNQL